MKIDKKSLDNFWYYHKLQVIIAIVIIAMIPIYFYFNPNEPDPDLTVSYLFKHEASQAVAEKLEKKITGLVSDVNGDGKKRAVFLMAADPMKQEIIIKTAQADVHLGKQAQIAAIAGMGALEPLDDMISKSGIDTNRYTLIKAKPEGADTEHIYGISLAGSRILADNHLEGQDIYFAVRRLFNNKKNPQEKAKLHESAQAVFMEFIK